MDNSLMLWHGARTWELGGTQRRESHTGSVDMNLGKETWRVDSWGTKGSYENKYKGKMSLARDRYTKSLSSHWFSSSAQNHLSLFSRSETKSWNESCSNRIGESESEGTQRTECRYCSLLSTSCSKMCKLGPIVIPRSYFSVDIDGNPVLIGSIDLCLLYYLCIS